MPVITYQTKRRAGRAARTWALLAAKLQVTTGILLAVPALHPSAAISEILSDISAYLALEAKNASDDPPRPDYARETRAGIRPSVVAVEKSLPADAADFASYGERARSYLGAFVRALERSQGAEIAHHSELTEQHTREARHFGRLFAEVAPSLAAAVEGIDETMFPDAQGSLGLLPKDRDELAMPMRRVVAKGRVSRLGVEPSEVQGLSLSELARETAAATRALGFDLADTRLVPLPNAGRGTDK